MTRQKREHLRRKGWVLGDERIEGYFLNRRKTFSTWIFVCLVTVVLAATFVITPVKAQTSQLIPDWTSVTQDFFDLVPGAANPVLTGEDVTDRAANFVADPFLFHEGNSWYMFFEVETDSRQEIALATSSDGFSWTYQQIVLSVPSIYVSYPYVFKWEGTYYMMPHTFPDGVWLYKATNFPFSWTRVNILISNQNFIPCDASVFRYNNEWWMFAAEWDNSIGRADNLHLFYSSNLTNPNSWHEHPMSPIIVDDPSRARDGGRVIVFDSDRIIRLAQKCDVSYGEAVRAFEVDALTETYYAEHEVPESPIISARGSGWNSEGMHTVDPWWTGNSWLVAVDGIEDDLWSIGIYVTPLQSVTISPTQVRKDLGQSQAFNSSLSGGKPPYSYQWCLNDSVVLGANSQNWIFTPTSTGHYKVYVNVTDGLNTKVKSNSVTDIIVYSSPSVTISPTPVSMTIGNTQQFTSIATGGLAPYTYQWYYANNTAITGATTPTLNYKANFTGTYNLYLNVTDNLNYRTKSNTATLNIYSQPTASINPTSVRLYYGQSLKFSSVITGGSEPYTYQWYINDSAVLGATNPDWFFVPRANGNYRIHLNVTDNLGMEVKSNLADGINVYSVYLLVTTDAQTTYAKGQQVTFVVTVINQNNLQMETTLTLAVLGPGGYSFYDLQPVNVSANLIGKYCFNWTVPNVDGKYVVEASLVPAQLTAYDAKWLEAGDLSTRLGDTSKNSLVASSSLLGAFALFALVRSQVSSGACVLLLLRHKARRRIGF